MFERLAPLVICVCALLLTACAGQMPKQELNTTSVSSTSTVSQPKARAHALHKRLWLQQPTAQVQNSTKDAGLDNSTNAQEQAGTLLERGFKLMGTPYRIGGVSTRTGFDCSGFVGFLFREEAGIQLPRSTREMIAMDVPRVSRSELQAGDILFFNRRGRGRVTHVGIYIGDDRFIHSSSKRSGGVRVDSLSSTYWRASYMQAKRVLNERDVEEVAQEAPGA